MKHGSLCGQMENRVALDGSEWGAGETTDDSACLGCEVLTSLEITLRRATVS